MKISPLTKEAVESVLSNLSGECWKEAILMRMTKETYREKFMKMIGQPFTSAFYTEEGTCEAICFLESIGKYRWRTHFAGTEKAFKQMKLSLTRFLKGITDHLVQENDHGYIEILSACLSGKVPDWFESMGFRLAECDGVINKFVKQSR